MKRLIRDSVLVPACLSDGDASTPAVRKAWYSDLYKEDGKTIKDRWNTHDLDSSQVSSIRRALSEMSGHECAWCEQRLDRGWHVDHWLPKTPFPFVSYYWENLLPSCPGCNLRKKAAMPLALRGKELIDPILRSERASSLNFDKIALLPSISDRLVDPSFEDPTVHLSFLPEVPCWKGMTPQGDCTIRHLFAQKSDAEEWMKLSDTVRVFVENRVSDSIFDALICLLGKPTILKALIKHWRDLLTIKNSILTTPVC